MSNHPCHSDEVKRLNRASGQIEGIKKMIDEGRYCPDILTQLRAVRSSLKSIEANVLENHLGHCVTDVIKNGDQDSIAKKIEEIKTIFKRYEE